MVSRLHLPLKPPAMISSQKDHYVKTCLRPRVGTWKKDLTILINKRDILLQAPCVNMIFTCQTDAKRVTQGLSIKSLSVAILPEPRPLILPSVPMAEDRPLKLLLPSLKFLDLLDFLSFEELMSFAL